MKDEKGDLRGRTKAFALRIIALYETLPRTCLKELEETGYWLELLADSGAVKPSRLVALLDETSHLTAILTTIAKKVRARS